MTELKEIERRPAGVVERWYFARTRAEANPLVQVGFSLQLPRPLIRGELLSSLGAAAQRLPVLLPFLSTRVSGYSGDGPLEVYRVEDVFRPEEVLHVREEESFEHALNSQLKAKFDMERRLWGVWVHLPPSSLSQGMYSTAYVGAFVHHSIADGVAVLGVARTLVLLLNDPNLELGGQTGIPLPLEAKVEVKPTLQMTASAIFQAFVHPQLPHFLRALYEPRTSPWVGEAPPSEPPASRHIILSIPSTQMKSLLSLGKQHGVTFTTLLHTLLHLAISPLVSPNEHVFSSIPASLLPRVHSSQPPPIGGSYVGPVHQHCPPSSFPPTLASFWAACTPCSKALQDRPLLDAGIRGWGLVNLLSYTSLIQYHAKHLQSTEGRNSFALSNLRHVRFAASEVEGGWVPQEGTFAQPMRGSSGVMLADVLGVDVEGREGGGCRVVFSWEEGVVSEQTARGIVQRTREGWEWVISQGEKEAGQA